MLAIDCKRSFISDKNVRMPLPLIGVFAWGQWSMTIYQKQHDDLNVMIKFPDKQSLLGHKPMAYFHFVDSFIPFA